MEDSANRPHKVAIIGGGISGLAAAHRVTELSPQSEVTLFESSDRLGGILRTVRQDGFLIEQSADSFITSVPAAVELCKRIGFADQLIPTNAESRGAMVVARGKLRRVPQGFVLMAPEQLGPVLRSPILSWRGKLRFLREWFVSPRQIHTDESLASFARRRYGSEVFQRLVQPLVGGIYTADPERLSLAATLPRFQQMERTYGSLIRAARAQRKMDKQNSNGNKSSIGDSGARYSMFVAPKHGFSSMVDAIAGKLPKNCARLNTAIERIERGDGNWLLHPLLNDPCNRSAVKGEAMQFHSVIIATAAAAATTMLRDISAALATDLAAIELAGSAVVVLGYDRNQVLHPLDSFGFVVPAIERRRILSASFSSVKFSERAPLGKVLIRVFIGGALQSEYLDLADDELARIAEEELRDLLGIRGGPCLSKIFRWRASMPQYHLGHLDRWRRIQDTLAQFPGLVLAGNAYEGVGIPQCIRSGEAAAEKAVSPLSQ
jgi:oxygen-dependent protoporphyrinogen oxidase